MKSNKKLVRFLKQFFTQTPEYRHPDDDAVLSTPDFYRLLDNERFRADRLGNPFSLIIIPLPSEQQAPEKVRELTSLIHAKTRIIDELGWFAPGTLGLYLFNTPYQGAEILIDRIKDDLDAPELLDESQIMVYPDTRLRSTEQESDELVHQAGREQRRQERLDLDLAANIELTPTDGGEAQRITTNVSDLSAGGAYLMTDTPLEPNTEIKLEIRLPQDDDANGTQDVSLSTVGRVVRTDDGGIAVQFKKPEDNEAGASAAH
ncbi:MAG: PilZ domain-containing protein [Pontibacterium sp.]